LLPRNGSPAAHGACTQKDAECVGRDLGVVRGPTERPDRGRDRAGPRLKCKAGDDRTRRQPGPGAHRKDEMNQPPEVPQPAAGGPEQPPPSYMRGPPAAPSVERVRAAWSARAETDYIFSYWTALGWTILTLGIFSFYVIYRLVGRMRDHNARRLELFEGSIEFAWQEAGRRGLQEELTPSFQRAASQLDVMRQMTRDFREPVIWVILALVARGLVDIIAFVLLDQDLVRHDRAEVGVEYELSLIYGRLGQHVPSPDQNRVKGRDNYVGRIVATIFSFGFYMFWWFYNQMEEPNRHFRENWVQEDALADAVRTLCQ
jgi:hypothetical protein